MGRQSTQTQRSSRRSEKLTERQAKEKFSSEPKYNIKLIGKTKTQIEYLKALSRYPLVVARGSAGTGKTFLAVGHACKLFQEGKIDRIVMTRPTEPTGRSIGYFSGSITEKLNPWLSQMLFYMVKFLGNQAVVDLMIKRNELELIPIEVIRGRSFENSCVIADEMQNANINILKCISTRVGENSQLIVLGDQSQSDLKTNDFDIFANLLIKHKIPDTEVITFTVDDCVRSDLCGNLIRMFAYEKI